jgi:hypothetical protein
MIARACMNEEGYVVLREAMRINMQYGHYITFGCECKHDPKCIVPTQEQEDALNVRLKEDLKGVKERNWLPSGAQGNQGPIPETKEAPGSQIYM